MDRGQRALVAGVHRLEHVQGLGAADLADDDAVGTHAQGVPDELADADPRWPSMFAGRDSSGITWSRSWLGRVLDRDDPLVPWHEGRERVQRRRLTDAGTAGDEDVQLPCTQAARKYAALDETEPKLIRSSIVYGSRENFRMVRTDPRSGAAG